MLFRIEVGTAEGIVDAVGKRVIERVRNFLNMEVAACRIVKVYTVSGLSEIQLKLLLARTVWHDPFLQRASIGPLPCLVPLPYWFCEIGFRPGVTDNEATIARESAALALDIPKRSFSVYTATQYRFVPSSTAPLSKADIIRICKDILCNELIQTWRIKNFEEWRNDGGFEPHAPSAGSAATGEIATVDLNSLDSRGLEELSRKNTWALNLEEMRTIAAYFNKPETIKSRQEKGLPASPTDAEMEVLAQTWSEHCKHKIFASRITLFNCINGRHEHINNLYKTCIRDTTDILRKRMGKDDYCHSVFKDNAGVISFIDGYDACIKVETHNSPSALDPYGGALTGIVGVNRDPLGTGMGADLVANIDVFCFASPFYSGKLPPRILHPARILEGVRQGVEDGGNKSGIPTINGSLVFDERYLGKPLVFCGTVGLLPAEICGHPGYEKAACPGDVIVMAGGRIGKDGIHGATFSSEELHASSPATAVQIGDPLTQKKLYDFILRARDACLYHSITDNGAGGLSSSVGEMAQDTGGCVLNLELAPLKYEGLRPWEILLSEAQERMTFAVPPEKLEEFLDLAAQMDVEANALGNFTESGFFEARYNNRLVACISMDFLYHGDPQLELNAEWSAPVFTELAIEPDWQVKKNCEFLKTMLSRLNICSKESIIRQYDHEVRGGSAIKPVVGIMRDGPSDAAVFRPLVESDAGLVIAHGICPKYSDYDTYWMMANAMDEAIRNAVAVGANPDYLAGVDNFCWCDPIYSPTNPDGPHKLAQLVRACRALRQFSLTYGLPCISGKDSMKNDYVNESMRIAIPPTVLFTVMGVIDNVIKTQTSDFKTAGDYIYLLGGTWKELGASEAANELGLSGGAIPSVNASQALARYRAVYALMGQRAISACHDCSDGGLAVALAEMCIGGRLGCQIDLNSVPVFGKMNDFEILYSESASRLIATIKPDLASLLDVLGMWQICRRIGTVTNSGSLVISGNGQTIIDENVENLASAFKKTLS